MKTEFSPKSIVNSLGAGLCLLDREYRILWINDIQASWFDNKRNLCGRHCYEAFEHRQHICRGCPVAKTFQTGKIEEALRPGIVTKDGRKHCFQIVSSPVKDSHNRVVQALELVRDITRRKKEDRRAYAELNTVSHKYRKLVNSYKRLGAQAGVLRVFNRKLGRARDILKERYRHVVNKFALVKEELNGLIKVSKSISYSGSLKNLALLVARLSCKIAHADAAVLRLVEESNRTLVSVGSYGLTKGLLPDAPIIITEGLSGKAVATLRPQSASLKQEGRGNHDAEKKPEGFYSALAVPIIFQGRALGVITTYSKKPHSEFKPDEMRLLCAFASEIGLAINEARLYEDIHRNYFNTIHALVLAMEARDPYTRGHADRVTRYSVQMAKHMELSDKDVETLRYAGEVHDVGKIGISDLILNKPDWLTASERATVEGHSARGAEMLQPLQFLDEVIPVVRHHHEHYDGSGYPDGLKKDKIPIMARIISCADAFDAMTSERPYRKNKLTIDQALEEIRKNSGTQFDPRIARIFIRLIKERDASRKQAYAAACTAGMHENAPPDNTVQPLQPVEQPSP